MRKKWILTTRPSIVTGEPPVYNVEKVPHSDEDFVPGIPTKQRVITHAEFQKIVATGDPGSIEWPQKMLPEHKDGEVEEIKKRRKEAKV